MRRKNAKHIANVQKESKNKKPLLQRTYIKFSAFVIAFVLIGAALIVPTTTLDPDVEAIANQKAIAFSVGDLEDFSDVIVSNCKTEVATEPVTEQETKETTEPAVKEEEETQPVTEETTEPETEEETETEATEDKTSSTIVDEVSSSVSKSDYLISISNPDENYNPGTVYLSDSDRDLLERLVMGEAGAQGFTGCALVAQAVKDTMVSDGISTVSDVISKYGYYGSTSNRPNSDAVEAVSYIFDQNGSAVQHRIMYFYDTKFCSSKWHETQNFVLEYCGTRYFDRA